MTAGPIVADVTQLEHREPAYPDEVERLQELGFRPLGRFSVLAVDRRGQLVYPKRERDRFIAWQGRPAATILAAPDETAYAAVDTYGDARLVRVRSALEDGSLVETIGLERTGILRPWPWLDPYAGFTALDTDDRAVRLLLDATTAEVVATHADHLRTISAARASTPARHHDRDDALHLWIAAFQHAARNQARARRLARLIMLVPAAVWVALVLYLLFGSDASVATVFLTEVIGFVVVVVTANVIGRLIAKQRWWRAPYLA